MKTKISLILILISLIAGHQYMFSEIAIWQVPKLMSSMRAKEFCSCYFMLGNSEEYCLDVVKKGYPIFHYELDKSNEAVKFSNYISTSEAIVRSRKYGCNLR